MNFDVSKIRPVEEIEAEIAAERDAELGELDAKIARAATSWSPAFPGRREVSRMVANQARAIMNYARRENARPSDVHFIKAGIEADGEEFYVAVEGLSLSAARAKRTVGITLDEDLYFWIKSHPEVNLSAWVRGRMRDEFGIPKSI
jgi:hypothetical protein